MPFIKESHAQGPQPSLPFIARTGEILFFVHNILKPEAPTHNILSISGQGGVGKSTLVSRFLDEVNTSEHKDYCLAALVDERQATPVSIMEKFAQQLHIADKFEKMLKQYKEALRKRQAEEKTLQDALFEGVPDMAGAIVERIPVAGPFLQGGAKVATTYALKKHHASRLQEDAEFLETAVDELTRAFVHELNHLADAKVTLSSVRKKRQRRIVLFFDTFEQLATEATPWLLDYFLAAQVSGNVVLVVAGRDPIECTSPNDPKRWLPYCDGGDIYWMSLNSFTEDETRVYLIGRGITDAHQIANIWQLSRGLPLYLGLLTSNPRGDIDPTKDVVINFLRWIPEKEQVKRELALDAALLSRPFNQDDLEAFSYVPESELGQLYQWLTQQPFVRSQSLDGRYLYHDVARDLFSRHLYQRSQKHYYEIRRALAAYYQELLERIRAERGEEWLEVLLAVVSQLLLLPDQASYIQVIKHILSAYSWDISKDQHAAIVRSLRDLSQESPSHYICSDARWLVTRLLNYIQPDDLEQQVLAAGALLEKVAHESPFPLEFLGQVYIQCGYAYRFLGEEKLALENFQRALDLLEPTKFNERGGIYLEAGNYQEALAHYNRALEQDPNDAAAYYGRGFAYTHQGEYKQGIADFDRALERDPNYVEAHNGRGWAYFYAGEYQRAVEAFSHRLKLNPDHTAAIRGLGLTYDLLKEHSQALTLFDRRIELDDTAYPNAFTDRSSCYLSLKEYQRSIEDCNRAIALAPKYAQAYFQRGLTYLWSKDLQLAQADFTRSYELEPTWMRCALIAEWIGMCWETVDPNTLERLETMVTVDPQACSVHLCQGMALLLRRNFKEALAELEQAIALNQNRWDVYFWKGMACLFLGRDIEAIVAIEKALDLELPPILLAPLNWFVQERPDFYEKYVEPLLAKHE